MSNLNIKVATRQARVVPGKHGMEDIMLVLTEAETKAKVTPVNMYQGMAATKEK